MASPCRPSPPAVVVGADGVPPLRWWRQYRGVQVRRVRSRGSSGRVEHRSAGAGTVVEIVVLDGEPPVPGRGEGPVGGAVLRMLLGGQLRRFREAAGVTSERAGYEIRGSVSKI